MVTAFFVCFWVVVGCALSLTALQLAFRANSDPTANERLRTLGSPGIMYFVWGSWLPPGTRYARSLATFELARDAALPRSLRVMSAAMSVLFIALATAWVVGIAVAILLACR